jgi:hypothetical protein
VTFNPDSGWSLSASFGFLRSPEPLDAGHSMHRMGVSVANGGRLNADGHWATTLLWGANAHSGHATISNSALAEGELVFDSKNTMFARAEFVQKPADDLAIAAAAGRTFDVGSLTLGYIRELTHARGMTLGLGVLGTVNALPSALEPAYGSRLPLGMMVFLRVRALGSAAAPTSGMAGMKMY